jgi:hypothetical protein
VELLARNVEELAPLVNIVLLVCCLCAFGGAVRLRGCAVDELEDERSSCDDSGSSGQAIQLSLISTPQTMAQLWALTSLVQQYSQAPNSFR